MKIPFVSSFVGVGSSSSVTCLVARTIAFCWLALCGPSQGADARVEFTPATATVNCYDFAEIVLNVTPVPVTNPFTDVAVTGTFGVNGEQPVSVEGFCDSADGRVFRIRFMPAKPGRYDYTVKYRDGGFERTQTGVFTAQDKQRKGLVRVDAEFPSHFRWQGTQERFFWNGTTAYWLAGWDEESIGQIIERLDKLKVTRVRVALNGRVKDGQAWFEPVYPSEKFSFLLNPWVAKNPTSVEAPDFDVTRFNIAYWQKFERLLRLAREKDLVVSVIFYVDGSRRGVDPFGPVGMGGGDEQRYYRYAIARLAPFSNVMWDLANEYRLFRNDAWAEKMGTLVKQWDPYHHLTSTHGHGDFHFRASSWADFAMYQSWDEHGGYDFMLRNYREQAKTGRIIPQINEEYGYEDHYPQGWGENRHAPARSAENRRRIAWEIYLAGGYQTTGERANQGTGRGADSGGGWINGRGDDEMTMLQSYGYIYDFFTGIAFWKLRPDPELVASSRPAINQAVAGVQASGGRALGARSDKGDLVVVYLPQGGIVELEASRMADGLRPLWFSPRDGGTKVARALRPATYRAPDANDWVLLLSVPCDCSFREHDLEFEQ